MTRFNTLRRGRSTMHSPAAGSHSSNNKLAVAASSALSASNDNLASGDAADNAQSGKKSSDGE